MRVIVIADIERFIKRGILDISARTYNTKEFNPKIDPFMEVIMENGIEIKC